MSMVAGVRLVGGLLSVYLAYLLHRRRPIALRVSAFAASATVPLVLLMAFRTHQSYMLYLDLAESGFGALEVLRPTAGWLTFAAQAVLAAGLVYVLGRSDVLRAFGLPVEGYRRAVL